MPPAAPGKWQRSTSGRAGCSASTRRVVCQWRCPPRDPMWTILGVASRQAPRCALPARSPRARWCVSRARLAVGGALPNWQAEPVPVLVAIADQLPPGARGTGRYTHAGDALRPPGGNWPPWSVAAGPAAAASPGWPARCRPAAACAVRRLGARSRRGWAVTRCAMTLGATGATGTWWSPCTTPSPGPVRRCHLARRARTGG